MRWPPCSRPRSQRMHTLSGPAPARQTSIWTRPRSRRIWRTLHCLAVLSLAAPACVLSQSDAGPSHRVGAGAGAMAWAIGGALLLLGICLTWRQVRIAREGRIADRFGRAIDQLGSAKLEVRLGAIHTLARIDRRSERDHWGIVEVLCAFIREQPPPAPGTASAARHPLAADVQAALSVLCSRPSRMEKRTGLNLATAHLEGAVLVDAHLEGAILSRVHLEEALLVNAHLEGAILDGAHLEDANLNGARLDETYLSRAHMERAILVDARMRGAILYRAHLDGAYVSGAQLQEAMLEGATGLRAA
jgi:hypothetical protein